MSVCPPQPPGPCAQVCPPAPPCPPCLGKPIMRSLHMSQTKRVLAKSILASIIAGACVYFFVAAPRKAAYKEYYKRAEFDDWADEMARKGLFQSVPMGSLKDNQHMKK